MSTKGNFHEACKSCEFKSCPYLSYDAKKIPMLCLHIQAAEYKRESLREKVQYEKENPLDPDFGALYTYAEMVSIAAMPHIKQVIRDRIKLTLLKSEAEIQVYYGGNENKAMFYLWRVEGAQLDYRAVIVDPHNEQCKGMNRATRYTNETPQDHTTANATLTYPQIVEKAFSSDTDNGEADKYQKALIIARKMANRKGVDVEAFTFSFRHGQSFIYYSQAYLNACKRKPKQLYFEF